MEPMSDEERERPSRSMLKTTWEMRHDLLEQILSLALSLNQGKIDSKQILSLCESSFYAGAGFMLSTASKVGEAVATGAITEEAGADIMTGLSRELNDHAASKEAELIARVTLARTQAESKGKKHDSNTNPSPPDQASTPRSEGNADGAVGNG